MRSQIEKNKETLLDYIENHAGDEMKPDIAAKLSNARGAYKALCMVGKEDESQSPEAVYAASKERMKAKESTPELDGDTEFEQVIMKIPSDQEHMVKLTHIFDKHLQGLKMVNSRAYNSIMEQLREVAKS